MDSLYTYLVCVRCFTFNQHAYIEDAMNGFCMQKTDFPFVCIIVDDASTDGEQEVIKKYFETNFDLIETEETEDYILNFGRHKTNKNCSFVVLYLKYNHRSIKKDKFAYFSRWHDNCKYLALCEGDDYWIDENKLQKQVDFLEEHEDYSMVFHSAIILHESNIKTKIRCSSIENREYTPTEVFENWIVPTASILMRQAVINVKNKKRYNLLNGDIIIILNCAKIGKLRGMKNKMSVYRIHETGVTYDQNLAFVRVLKFPNHLKFIKDNYPFIKRSVINTKLGYAYAERANYDECVFQKIKDWILAVYYRPSFITNKLSKIIHRKKDFSI